MNERIEKLAREAGVVYHTRLGAETNTDDLEKFAELIVWECIEEIKHLRMKYDTHRDVEPEENDRYIDAFLQAEVRLKEYFGVEE